MKKVLSVILAILMLFSVASVSIVGASAASDPIAVKITSTCYEINVNQVVTKTQATTYAETKLVQAADGIEAIYVIYAVGETFVTKQPTWEMVKAYRSQGGSIITLPISLNQEYLGSIITNIALGKSDYYVYGSVKMINPFLFDATKVTDVNKMEVTTEITSSNMAVAVAYGLLSKELANATSEKPIYAAYAQTDGNYSVIKSVNYDGTNIWSTSYFTYTASELSSLAGEGRLYQLSKNSAGTLWDMIVEFFTNIINWFISLFQ